MGNSSSSARGHHDDTVDFGSLVSQGVYTGPQDWNQAVVAQFIVQRKLAPFYRPLEEYDENWDEEQILAARKELPENPETASHNESTSATPSSKSDATSSFRSHGKRPSTQKEVSKFSEAAIYRGAVECPICFLVRPVSTFQSLRNSRAVFPFNFLPTTPSQITLHIHTPIASPDCATPVHRMFAAGLSIIPRTSTTQGVATKQYAQNVLSKSSDPNRRPHTWLPNRRLVLTACRSISE